MLSNRGLSREGLLMLKQHWLHSRSATDCTTRQYILITVAPAAPNHTTTSPQLHPFAHQPHHSYIPSHTNLPTAAPIRTPTSTQLYTNLPAAAPHGTRTSRQLHPFAYQPPHSCTPSHTNLTTAVPRRTTTLPQPHQLHHNTIQLHRPQLHHSAPQPNHSCTAAMQHTTTSPQLHQMHQIVPHSHPTCSSCTTAHHYLNTADQMHHSAPYVHHRRTSRINRAYEFVRFTKYNEGPELLSLYVDL